MCDRETCWFSEDECTADLYDDYLTEDDFMEEDEL